MALEHAHMVLDWQENLPADETPPRWMWPFHDELEVWFEEVDTKRQEKYGANTSTDESVPLMQNEMARGRR